MTGTVKKAGKQAERVMAAHHSPTQKVGPIMRVSQPSPGMVPMMPMDSTVVQRSSTPYGGAINRQQRTSTPSGGAIVPVPRLYQQSETLPRTTTPPSRTVRIPTPIKPGNPKGR